RPLLKSNSDVTLLLHNKITNANKIGSPVSTLVLQQFLAENDTWVSHKGVVLVPGHRPLLIIFEVIIIFCNDNKLYGELVSYSINIWDPTIKPLPNKRNSKIVPDQVDYHGNFNAKIFESLFTKLCIMIKEKYDETDIHIDSALYHKRRAENIPTSISKKSELRN
ncbi:8571_t:CDS:2, partial [Scutellospora calospora]